MDNYFFFLKALRETGEWASADTWQLIECNKQADIIEIEDFLEPVFGSLECVHGSMPIGKYVAVLWQSGLYTMLSGETLMFPQCVFQTASQKVWVFYRLDK